MNKKYLLPLILILCLALTLTGYSANLFSTYDQRIKLTIDNTKIDSELTWFPVTVFLKDTFNYTSQYPPAQSDTYVKATSKLSTSFWAYFATDPTKSLTGLSSENSWLWWETTNQRFHVDLGSAKTIRRIYYENFHNSGGQTTRGVENFTFWGSNTAASFAELTYATDTNWTQITTSQSTFDEHSETDVADPKYITCTNSVAYRYYSFKFADNYGDVGYIGIRRIELQTAVQSGIFAEFDADEDFDRCAFTTSDGSTQVYADCELFDDSESKAIYHIAKTGVAISNTGTTDFYMYYDNDAGHNTTYISKSGGTAAQSVYDANTKANYNLNTLLDSTSNNKDLTKFGTVSYVSGKIGNASSADWGGTNYLTHTSLLGSNLGTGNLTMSVLFLKDGASSQDYTPSILSLGDTDGNPRTCLVATKTNGYAYFQSYDGSSTDVDSSFDICDNAWHLVTAVREGTSHKIYVDGDLKNTVTGTARNIDANYFYFGWHNDADYDILGQATIDRTSIATTIRSPAWLKATYNSLWDTLLTYGAEETGATFPLTKWNGVVITKWNNIAITKWNTIE